LAKPLIDFKFLLAFLALQYGEEEFDNRTVAEDLQALLLPIIKDPRLQDRLRPKLISNDLRRLYMMGFLRRKKVDRECENKHGKRYKCGYKYMYRINRQGWRYLKNLLREYNAKKYLHLRILETIRDINEERTAALIGIQELSALKLFEEGRIEDSKYILENVHESIDKKFSGQGYRRFTLKRILFEERARCWMILAEFQRKILTLERELEVKERRIRELEEKLRAMERLQGYAGAQEHSERN